MAFCYYCNTEITNENNSLEHVLLNACGGKLVSKELLCKKCNSILGKNADAELARQLNFFSNILFLKRSNGKPQKTTAKMQSSNEYIDILPNGSLQYSKIKSNLTKIDDYAILKISARNLKELKQQLYGYKRKYPKIDVELALKNTKENIFTLNEPVLLEVSVGGELANESIAKTAIEFYLIKKHNIEYVKDIICDLKKGIAYLHVEPIILKNNIYEVIENTVPHFILLKADSQNKMLYCYIEYFSVYGFLVKLNENYLGPDFENTYFYDLISRSEKSVPIMNSLKSDFVRNYSLKTCVIDRTYMIEHLSTILTIANQLRQKVNIEKIFNKTLNDCFVNKKTITDITYEDMNSFERTLSDKIFDYYLSLLNK